MSRGMPFLRNADGIFASFLVMPKSADELALYETVAGKRKDYLLARDEVSQLLQALKTMTGSLAAIVGEFRHSSDTIASASAQIASGNNELFSRAQQQSWWRPWVPSMRRPEKLLTSLVRSRQPGENRMQA